MSHGHLGTVAEVSRCQSVRTPSGRDYCARRSAALALIVMLLCINMIDLCTAAAEQVSTRYAAFPRYYYFFTIHD